MGDPRWLLAAFTAALLTASAVWADTVGDCHIGSYRLADSGVVDIGASDGDHLRWRTFDGRSGALHPQPGGGWKSTLGWTDRPDGIPVSLASCPGGAITFNGVEGKRIDFAVTETRFAGDGVTLAGRLVMPRGDAPVPIVVLIHGSESDSALDFYSLQRILPAEGVGAFVYDKRGTGRSDGKYTQDFNLLANDAVAAMREARHLAGRRAGRIGYQGGSEGGWVAPIAASRAPVDFVIVGFGLAVSPIDEDREELALEMGLKNHSAAETAEALEIGKAADSVFASNFTGGFARFEAVRAHYSHAPWYKDVHGNFTHFILDWSDARLHTDKSFVFGTPWNYDPMPLLSRSHTPELWILGTDDLEAPSARTSRLIEGLGARGLPFTLAMFPHAEHGVYEYETGADGERTDTRNPAGYFVMIRDFARDGRLSGSYGDSALARPLGR